MKGSCMIIIKYTGRVDFEYDIQGLLRTFFPGESMVTDREAEADLILEAEFYDYFEKIPMVLRLEGKPYTEGDFKRESERTFRREGSFLPGSVPVAEENPEGDSIIFREDYDRVRKETKNRLKRLLFNLLKEYTGKTPVWGTLSGIRPTKITSSYLEQGYSEAEAKQRFMREYYVSGEKAEQCVNISRKEAEILKDIDYKNGYSLYIGIPFCPSTCLYCYFTSYPLSKYRTKTDAYIEALGRELEYIAEACADREPDTIYIGGGTPTTLEPYQLDSLLGIIHELFNTKAVSEFTVEAGRPDSITQEKLKVLGTYDVSRISINPQTMNQKTLDIIGRHHTVEDFLRAYDMARTNGFENINMDFILGLPDETEEDVRRSMEWVERLKPDSLTIHSLALKRAARLNILKEQYEQYTIENSDEIMEITRQTAKKLDLTPYYLYRQKNMAGNLENIGYAKDGKAGIYNILIMEEKQTILAAGAGSSTKMVHPDGMKITRIENVKDVDLYISDIDKMIERKRSFFEKTER